MNVLLLTLALCGAEPKAEAAPVPPDEATQWKEIRNFKVKEGFGYLAPFAELKDGTVTLRNRGTIVSQNSYPNGATLTATWKWTKGSEKGKCHDHLAVVFFSTAHQSKWPFEADNGLVVRFNPGARHMVVQLFKEGAEVDRLATVEDLTFEKGKDYKVQIDVMKTTYKVSIDGKKLAEGKIPEGLKGEKILVFNREPVAEEEHESFLTGYTVTPQK